MNAIKIIYEELIIVKSKHLISSLIVSWYMKLSLELEKNLEIKIPFVVGGTPFEHMDSTSEGPVNCLNLIIAVG